MKINVYLVTWFSLGLGLGSGQVKIFHDIPSEEDRSNFDSFPLRSRTVGDLDWCPVRLSVSTIRLFSINVRAWKR